jgi:hypothetical protein
MKENVLTLLVKSVKKAIYVMLGARVSDSRRATR